MRRLAAADLDGSDDEQEINITPLIDIVFIMLIFFIVTASFVKEIGLDVNRPDSQTQQANPDKPNILVQINASNEIYIGGRRVDPRSVRANIERLHAENPEAMVAIQPARKSQTRLLVQVMDAARQAGLGDKVAIAEPVD